jgi:predicted homoserine dehydrogenase-like protein
MMAAQQRFDRTAAINRHVAAPSDVDGWATETFQGATPGSREGGRRRGLRQRALPIGLAHNVRLTRAVARDQVVSVDDVSLDSDLDVVALRREMETGPGDSFH